MNNLVYGFVSVIEFYNNNFNNGICVFSPNIKDLSDKKIISQMHKWVALPASANASI